ncbi:Ataxin 2-like, partial [Perkinsus olseni]
SLAGKERVLQRWDSKTDDALDKPLESSSFDDSRIGKGGAHWDQFAVNERKFNVKSTYNEDLYTTTLDTSKISPEKQRRAERIAKEIEHSQNYGGKEEGTGAEDEEALFSAVQGTGGYATGGHKQHPGVHATNQPHQKPQLSPEQISERARMKADFESHLRMIDAGQRHHRAPAASAGNTRLNALNLEPASVRVSQLGRSPKQTSTSPRPPQPLTQENLHSHNQALQSSAAAHRQGQQQTPGSKHSLLGASPVMAEVNRKPIPQLPPTASAGAAGVSPIVTEMKGINALNLEPALPKLPEKDREDWINANATQPAAGQQPTPAAGGKGGKGARPGAWQQQQGGALLDTMNGSATPPLTAKGGKGKGVKGGKGGGLPAPISAPQGSPQGGPFQGGAAAAGHQPSQLMMNAVHNAQNAQMQQQDAGKPPVGKGGAAAAGGGRKNLTLDSTQSGGPKRSGFSFNPNANTFTPSTAGVPTQGATLNINVTPGGSLSGTLKNVNYDGYDAASAAAAEQQQ